MSDINPGSRSMRTYDALSVFAGRQSFRWLGAVVAGILALGSGCDNDAAELSTGPGVPSTTSDIISGSAAGSVAIFTTVASLKATSTSNLDSKSIYFLRGYYAQNDTSEGRLIWDPTSTAPEDCVFVFQRGSNVCPTFPMVGGTAGRFIRLESGTFDARKGGLKMDGTASQFANLSKVYTACTDRGGIDTLWLGPGTLDIRDGGSLSAGAGATRSIGILGAGRLATRIVGNARGTLAQQMGIFSQTQEPDSTAYSSHSWIQDLTNGAGTTVFTGVTNTGTLAVNDWVFVRLGADPTDQGEEYERLITKITSIAGSTVTVSNPVRTSIGMITPSINANRMWNKHDMLKITNLFNGFEMSDLALDNVHLSVNTTIDTHLHDLYVPYGTATFSAVQDENTVMERVTADLITGVNIGPGANSHLGWFYQGWGHINTVLRDVNIHLLDGVNLFSYESQSRSMSLDNFQVNINSTAAVGGAAAISTNVAGLDGPRFGNLALTGFGSANFDRNSTVANLSIMGGDGIDPYLNLFLQGWQITESLFFKGKSYKQIKRAPSMLIPLAPSTTILTPYPLVGVPRRVRIRPSTLTGVTLLAQGTFWMVPVETDLRPFLVAGQFSEPNYCTQLGVNYPGGGRSDRQYIKIVTDGTVPPGAYVEVESEFWVADDSLTTQPAEKVANAGAPTMNAQFVSQEYFDTTNRKTYVAVTTGGGAADWILLGP